MQKDCLFFSDGNSHTKMKEKKISESELAVTGSLGEVERAIYRNVDGKGIKRRIDTTYRYK